MKGTIGQKEMFLIMKRCLQNGGYVRSAPLVAFIYGDWIVLITYVAILVPLSLRVRVALRPRRSRWEVFAYEAHENPPGRWLLNEEYSLIFRDHVVQRLAACETILRDHIRIFPGASVYVFSEVPFGSSLHETTAAVIALSKILSVVPDVENIERIAGHLMWYPAFSRGPIMCCTRAAKGAVCAVNQSEAEIDDGGRRRAKIDFLSILSLDENAGRYEAINRAYLPSSIHCSWLNFPTWRFALFHQRAESDVGHIQRSGYAGDAISELRSLRRDCFSMAKGMMHFLRKGEIAEIGRIMSDNNNLLAEVGLASSIDLGGYRHAEVPVLGAKEAAAHKGGAVLVLLDIDSPEEREQAIKRVARTLGLLPYQGKIFR